MFHFSKVSRQKGHAECSNLHVGGNDTNSSLSNRIGRSLVIGVAARKTNSTSATKCHKAELFQNDWDTLEA